MPAHVVWFKRDLRVSDHEPLREACAAGVRDGWPVVCLWVDEPAVRGSAEWDERHGAFVEDCLRDLDAGLGRLGTRLTRMRGDFPGVLEELDGRLGVIGGIGGLWSHQETGGAVTFERDKGVARWCRGRGVRWVEVAQHGVFRGLRDRDGWAGRWTERMAAGPRGAPVKVPCVRGAIKGWRFDEGVDGGVEGGGRDKAGAGRWQRGGEVAAAETLRTFLHERGVNYRADMASPVTGFEGCSRLSAHLAWGSISMRTVHHAVLERRRELLRMRGRDPRWLASLTSFAGRLRWHCHFIQKLESEPGIEFRNMHRGYDGLRVEDVGAWGEEERRRFEAWRTGRTGYPFVDACMRCLNETGWMNFRMRSMLVSFASYHLWLHWRATGEHLARQFVDFEPGIHWCQMQMQSGTTGINTVRMYNPVKQGHDQDPTGEFIRRWVPELRGLVGKAVHEPWTGAGDAEVGGLFAGVGDVAEGWALGGGAAGYPRPIVDHVRAGLMAKERIFAVRQRAESRAEARRVYMAHGSRRSPTDRARVDEDRAMD